MNSAILQFHAQRYPLMEPTDAVKLLYQNEFGVGHLITNTQQFADRLSKEMETAAPLPGIPLMEPIGNGMVRVMLNSVESQNLDRDQLLSACLKTAAEHHGSMDSFLHKLDELRRACQNGMFAFSPDELEHYLADYVQQGCPPVSHSEVYREAYHPAYRVIIGL